MIHILKNGKSCPWLGSESQIWVASRIELGTTELIPTPFQAERVNLQYYIFFFWFTIVCCYLYCSQALRIKNKKIFMRKRIWTKIYYMKMVNKIFFCIRFKRLLPFIRHLSIIFSLRFCDNIEKYLINNKYAGNTLLINYMYMSCFFYKLYLLLCMSTHHSILSNFYWLYIGNFRKLSSFFLMMLYNLLKVKIWYRNCFCRSGHSCPDRSKAMTSWPSDRFLISRKKAHVILNFDNHLDEIKGDLAIQGFHI